jgi:hypothetical protein
MFRLNSDHDLSELIRTMGGRSKTEKLKKLKVTATAKRTAHKSNF